MPSRKASSQTKPEKGHQAGKRASEVTSPSAIAVEDHTSVKEDAAAKPTVLDAHGYALGNTLGQGSYATVKEAYSQRHKTKVAIKIISKRKAPQDYLAKFLPREIEVVKLLKHPNLVLFLQSIETNNRVYLVMENATGGDLLDVIRDRRVIPEKQAGFWFTQLVDGIEYCHSKGVVHRDLKCENVLLDERKNIKITDFGFARANMAPVNGSYTLSETYCGSYAYAAPEVLTGTPYIPQTADVWSLGVILYVMVFGRLPFDDSNHKKLLKQTRRGPVFPDPRPVSSDCCDILQKILSKAETRASLPQVKKHKWFRKVAPRPDTGGKRPSTSEGAGNNEASGVTGFLGKLFKGSSVKPDIQS